MLHFVRIIYPNFSGNVEGNLLCKFICRSSVTPPHAAKLRKMTHRDDDDVGSERSSSVSDDDAQVGRAQYLTANCVVFTYFRGDISQVVDDHFSRALSQTSDKAKGKQTESMFFQSLLSYNDFYLNWALFNYYLVLFTICTCSTMCSLNL